MITLDYFDPSDDIALFEADEIDRVAVTAQFLHESMDADVASWIFYPEAHDLGLDPWREITGMDKLIRGPHEGHYVLEFSGGSDLTVHPEHRVFVQRRNLPEGTEIEIGPKLARLITLGGRPGSVRFGDYRRGEASPIDKAVKLAAEILAKDSGYNVLDEGVFNVPVTKEKLREVVEAILGAA